MGPSMICAMGALLPAEIAALRPVGSERKNVLLRVELRKPHSSQFYAAGGGGTARIR